DVDRDAALGIDPIGHDAVGALVRHVEEAALAVDWIVVRADILLLGAMRSYVTLERRQGRVGAEGAVILHREHRDRIGAVVGDEQELAGGVEREVDGVVTAGRLAAYHAEVAGLAVDRVGGDVAAIAVHRIEEAACLVDGQERGVLESAEQLHVLERTAARVDAIDVDAFALAVSFGRGVAADVSEECHGATMPSGEGGDNRSIIGHAYRVSSTARPG